MKSQETVELSKLTLVMATYGRQDHAIRNMRYWSNTGVVFLVLDASPNPIKNKQLKNFGNNILYVHDQSDYNERIVNSFSKINTKYTQLICDDEFYPISSVISSIKELEKNEKIISCMGVCLGFEVDKKNKKIFSKRIYERLIGNYNHTMNPDPVERMSGYMTNYIPFLMYAMIRSETWKKAFFLPIRFKREKDMENNLEKFNFFASDEAQINMYLSFAGKSKVLPELYWLRSFGEHLTIREL
ncbi:TIGR00180 family glycosyltransferase, partial [Candidatus Pelagibacter sp.]|nr:TIGR00180 family glycosyltransferase [Candidatus Pelagibacter sp.]